MTKRIFILSLICSVMGISTLCANTNKPKLVVNIVVSQVRYDNIAKFWDNLSDGGFRKFANNGMVFTDAHYNFMQTITPTALATLTTGADPSTHGIVAERWVNYTTNEVVHLLDDPAVKGLNCDYGVGCYSPANITVPTLGDRLAESHPGSKVISIATSPMSAIIMGGQYTTAYWLDEGQGKWTSSSAYMPYLPEWVDNYNALNIPASYLSTTWSLKKSKSAYKNKAYTLFDMGNDSRLRRMVSFDFMRRRSNSREYSKLLATPSGNSLVTELFKQAFIYEKLGKNDDTDMVYLCYDSPRYVCETYGNESIEFEDMFYRLDDEIAELITFVTANMNLKDVVFVLTSDHGASDSYDYGAVERDRFNTQQFKVIVNGFMNAQYGPGDWVTEYCDRQLYLNRDLIYTNNLNLVEVQERVAAFVLQFRGVSHVLTSTAMSSSYFSGSYAEKMQNSFYPKRSGDIMINLMPGWIEEREGVRSASGSMYEYDTHVPLMMLGGSFHSHTVNRTVNIRDVAPTLARIMQISRPMASEGAAIEEVTILFEKEK